MNADTVFSNLLPDVEVPILNTSKPKKAIVISSKSERFHGTTKRAAPFKPKILTPRERQLKMEERKSIHVDEKNMNPFERLIMNKTKTTKSSDKITRSRKSLSNPIRADVRLPVIVSNHTNESREVFVVSNNNCNVLDLSPSTSKGTFSGGKSKLPESIDRRTAGLRLSFGSKEGQLYSKDDKVKVSYKFCNNHAMKEITIYWVDYGGDRVLRKTIQPGGIHAEWSFETHEWIVVSEDGEEFIISAQNCVGYSSHRFSILWHDGRGASVQDQIVASQINSVIDPSKAMSTHLTVSFMD
eukprot:TRINITY_DN17783_c0_g1_i1.p1 TRINITY_DN17783_c0_g1~~TRINITY_DN17783_c0_g1_i1.p1  ORF type:complete len:298 (+),score=58.18 TRINITY_DN17783_c0_g1_i1:40-933(+)